MNWFAASGLIVVVIFAGLFFWRRLDQRIERSALSRLASLQSPSNEVFSTEKVADLPEPVRRYFTFSINEGTPIRSVVQLEMKGELSLGTKEDPNYRPMTASQTLAAPFGFVWQLSSNGITGSDGVLIDKSWTRFWLFGLLPIVRVKGEDHRRSAFGRMVGESAFWSPASLLPGRHVTWQAVNSHHVRVRMTNGGLEQTVDIEIDDEGRPRHVHFQRWSNVNADKKYCYQSFGGDVSGYKSFEGYRLPTRVSAGNHYGSPDYFPFFKVVVTKIQFPQG